ncbi:MAG: cytochrome b/b6 domain-containing protein [Halioglobus sp.]|nr:cytochrome b/b6 domain-containing protein [Halioglobus sp.]
MSLLRNNQKVLWDIPTRVFHWAIVCLLPLAWLTAETDNYEWHSWVGYSVIVLVSFRLCWGVIGSRHSRFSDFLVGPRKVLAYLRGGTAASAGHNPLGGWSVVVLLLLLGVQGVSGLFNSEDILFEGPLYYAADPALRDFMGEVHEIAFNLLLGFIALHIAAVLYHQFRLQEKLLQAMVRGRAPGREGRASPAPVWLAVVLLAMIALGLWWGLSLAPQPDPGRWG